MKKIVFLLIFIIPIIFILNGCSIYAENRPFEQPNTKWVCTNPDIWFEVDAQQKILGEVNVDGEIKPITLFFKSSLGYFYWSNALDNSGVPFEDRILCGECSFSKNKMVFKVNYDTLFNNQYEELVFIREDKN